MTLRKSLHTGVQVVVIGLAYTGVMGLLLYPAIQAAGYA